MNGEKQQKGRKASKTQDHQRSAKIARRHKVWRHILFSKSSFLKKTFLLE